MKKVLFFALLLLMANSMHAQHTPARLQKGKPFVLAQTDELWSDQLKEQRILNIYLPPGYDTDHKTYPVIYLLDGSADEDFIHVVGIVQFLTTITETMPPAIVVGIGNVDRRRDFTFPTTVAKDKKDYPTTGGSAGFISFFEKDLEPYIQKEYRAGGQRTIIGQSLGGLLAAQVLLQKPALFDNYIIVSPSLWWDHESLLDKAPDLLKSFPARQTNVYLAVGEEEEKTMSKDAHSFAGMLQQSNKGIKVTETTEPHASHLTILHSAVYNAFEKLFVKAQ